MKTLPRINLQYWIFIISATTLGETGGDLISQSLHLGYAGATALLIILFIAALLFELKTITQHPALYWLVIILASLAGTTISDLITRTLGFGYGWGSLLVATILAIIFYLWRKSTQQISLQDGFNTKTESLYWAAILVSSTLGTAFGDYLAHATPLGFGGSALLLIILLIALAILMRLTTISRAICYWLAIVITHPLGAAMGDFMTKPQGINLGNVKASLTLLIIFGLVIAVSSKLSHANNFSHK